MIQRCHLCQKNSESFGTATVLGRHRVEYFRCSNCGFVQTQEPFWLEEAYQQALSALDVGAVSRNLRLSRITGTLLRRFFESKARYVDYGGGAGLFVRLMRDAGFDFYWMDKFAGNLFARGFEATEGPWAMLTAFEVFEHLVRPSDEIEQMTRLSKNILFTTVLLPETPPPLGDWWYYGLEHGQHVSIYTRRSLELLAQRLDLKLCSVGDLHLLTQQAIQPAYFRRCMKKYYARWLDWRQPRPSLTEPDYRLLAARAAATKPSPR